MMIFMAIFLTANPDIHPEMVDIGAVVVPYLNQHVSLQKNILYSSAFRASWTMLKEEIVGEDIRLRRPENMVRCLNEMSYHPPQNGEWFFRAG